MTYRQFKERVAAQLSSLYPAEEARAVAVRLLTTRLNLPDYRVAAEPATEIAPEALSFLESDLERLAEGCPLQYVLGYTEFAGLRIRVSEGCLIPRPETEELVSLIVERYGEGEVDPANILDLGTGSGCIAYAMADAFAAAQVFACDFSEKALSIACRQRVRLPGARPVFFQADLLGVPPAGLPKFDLMVSNPPYVRESERALMHRNVLDYEPAEALFVPDDDPLRFYAAIRRWADALLSPQGELWLEINEALGPQTAALFADGAEARKVELLQDFAGKDRFLRIRQSFSD